MRELKEADEFMIEFCNHFVDVYGRSTCIMNMHLHGHMQQCVVDYGPVYLFWCFIMQF